MDMREKQRANTDNDWRKQNFRDRHKRKIKLYMYGENKTLNTIHYRQVLIRIIITGWLRIKGKGIEKKNVEAGGLVMRQNVCNRRK